MLPYCTSTHLHEITVSARVVRLGDLRGVSCVRRTHKQYDRVSMNTATAVFAPIQPDDQQNSTTDYNVSCMTTNDGTETMSSRTTHSVKSALDAAQLLQQGQSAYAQKKYEEASESFNKALAASVSQVATQMHVLDHLVGVNVKLKRLDAALTNAKSMIRCDRTDARGYLRCGKIQRLQEDHEAACKWYDHGLRHVKSDDRLRPTLVSSFEKTREHAARQRMHSKSCDPTTCLPLEVVRMLFGYLDYKEHVRLLRVSKPLRKLLLSLPPITDTLDFSRAERTVSYNMLREAVRRLTTYPKTLQLARLSDPATKYLNDRLGLWCKKPIMQHFEVNDHRINLKQISWSTLPLQTLELGSETSFDDIGLEKVLLECNGLKKLLAKPSAIYSNQVLEFPPSFSQPNLEKLVLSTEIQFKSLSCFPNLVHLELYLCRYDQVLIELDLSSNSNLRYVEITAGHLFTRLPTKIEVMKARTTGGFTIDTQSSLRHLELSCDLCSLKRYIQLLECGALDQVRTFAIDFNRRHTQFDQVDVDFLFSHCSNFEHVHFKTPLQGDPDFGKLVGKTPKLRSLIIEDAQITGAFLADLLKAESCHVESVSLRGCSNVSSDTWDWMRQRGVIVDIENTSESHHMYGGRRVVDPR